MTQTGGSIIPAAWVGLPEDPRPASAPPPREAAATPGHPRASVLTSVDRSVMELVTEIAAPSNRGMCFVEPGKPCRGSGRCSQRGY
jgi:hypothetical protein